MIENLLGLVAIGYILLLAFLVCYSPMFFIAHHPVDD